MSALGPAGRTFARSALVAIVGAVVVLGAGLGSGAAHTGHGNPARLHQGSCGDLGPVAFPLNGAGADVSPDGTPIPAGAVVGLVPMNGVRTSVTTVAARLGDIARARHAINVYESDEAMGTAIACGNVGGQMAGDRLAIGLRELNGSGFSGVAVLREVGDQTEVSVYLGRNLSGG